MKLLLSAFGCAPGIGSEPEVGYRTLLAAASRHDVWVLTQSSTADALERALEDDPRRHRVHVERVEPPYPDGLSGMLGRLVSFWQHERWQRNAAVRSASLHRRVRFDLVHHVSMAAHWMPVGAAVLDRPFVWGPVGGGVDAPRRLLTELGVGGVFEDAVRSVVRGASERRPSVRAVQRRATVALVQNSSTAARLSTGAEIVLLCNAFSAWVRDMPEVSSRSADLAFVGRLVGWKGVRLAVRAMRYVEHPGTTLRLYGRGPEQDWIERAIRRWRLEGRVVLEGHLPRDELHARLATASALLHPALHEEGGNVVTEALSLGTPVVCLDHGGPGVQVGEWPASLSVAVKPSWPGATARAVAAAADRFVADRAPVPPVAVGPRRSFEQTILESYERAVEFHAERE